jgi:hypothetical protein
MMVTLPFESIFGSELLEVCVFIKLFELCIGFLFVGSSGDYSGLLAFKKRRMDIPCCV